MSEFTIALPTQGFNNVPVLTFGLESGSPFAERSPKLDNIKTVKLTKENIKAVAGHVINSLGELKVEVGDGRFSIYKGGYSYFSAKVGQWLVEEYNYRSEEVGFRTATAHEREKYDLR